MPEEFWSAQRRKKVPPGAMGAGKVMTPLTFSGVAMVPVVSLLRAGMDCHEPGVPVRLQKARRPLMVSEAVSVALE